MKIKKFLSKPYGKMRHCLKCISNRLLTIMNYIKLLRHDKKNGYSKKHWNYLVFDHCMGGGATQFLNDRLDNVWGFRQRTILVRYVDSIRGYRIEFIQDQNRCHYLIPSFEEIKKFLRKLCFEKIYVNELFEYDNIYKWLSLLNVLKEQKKCELIFLLHDYYCICPVSNLTLNTNQYCKLEYDCNKCLSEYTSYDLSLYGDICEWRRNWKYFLKQCNQIIAFSNDTKERIQAIYGDISIDIIPHQMYKKLREVQMKKASNQLLKVGILGNLSKIKGLCIVRQMVEYVKLNELPIVFILIGNVFGENIEESAVFCKTGAYRREELPEIIERNEIDIVFVPSVCPETFSYTVHEAIMMNLPIVCFDLGAQAEYVRMYEKGMIISEIDCKVTVELLLSYLEDM